MKIAITFLMLVGLLAGYQLTTGEDPQPEFETNVTVLLSEVPDGIRSEFVLHNESSKPKALTLKGTSCHCVSVFAKGKDLAVTENIEIAGSGDCVIEMTVRPNPKPGRSSQEALLQFGSNLVRCRQRANILSNIKTDQSVVELGDESQSVLVGTRYRSKPPELRAAVKGKFAEITSISVGETDPSEEIKTRYWNVVVERPEQRQENRVGRDQIKLSLDGVNMPARVLSVIVPSESGFDAPDVIRFGSVCVGESFERQVMIGLPEGEDSDGLSPAVAAPFELARWKVNGSSLSCTVRFEPNAESDFHGTLTLEGKSDTLEIPLKGKGVGRSK